MNVHRLVVVIDNVEKDIQFQLDDTIVPFIDEAFDQASHKASGLLKTFIFLGKTILATAGGYQKVLEEILNAQDSVKDFVIQCITDDQGVSHIGIQALKKTSDIKEDTAAHESGSRATLGISGENGIR